MTDSGVPFMITGAMREALRLDHGLDDEAIRDLTPGNAHKLLFAPNPAVVRKFFETFTNLAASSLGGRQAPGSLQLCRLHPNASSLVPTRYRLDEVEAMIKGAMAISASGANAYLEARFVRFDLRGRKRGGLEHTIAVFALVIDSDNDKGMGWTPPRGVVPTLVIETSPGNFQCWFFLKQAISPKRAQALGERVRKATGCDDDTGNPCQPYRIAGTVNYPNQAKIGRGRVVTWTRIVSCDPASLWTPEELERAFPSSGAPKPNGAAAPAPGTQGAKPSNVVNLFEAGLPDDLMGWIRDGVKPPHRSRVFMTVIAGLKRLGLSKESAYRLLKRYPNGIAAKYLTPTDRLWREVERAYDKVQGNPPVAPPVPPAASALVSPAILSSPFSQPLSEAHAAFKKWLGERYDTDVLDAVASAAAAERLGGDPLWLMIVAGSGGAKTETVRSLQGAGALIVSTISSEGALLSATARSSGATGGLLRKIGARGLLVIKDFTSILSADRNARNTVLAALREVHDGQWERFVGFSGGRTLSWAGRIVVIAACTTAWDAAHSVLATMGDRFVIVRGDTTAGRGEAALRAIGSTGREDAMRSELAASMGALIAGVDMGVRDLTDAETAHLAKLADIVTWARTGVERDYKGEVIDAHAWEMPTRFAKQLAQGARGAMSLGMPAEIAMRLAIRYARDSLEPLRRVLLLDVAAHPETSPDEVQARVARPLTTVKNTLVALHTLRLLVCDQRDEWRGRRLLSIPRYSLAPEPDRATLLSMSAV